MQCEPTLSSVYFRFILEGIEALGLNVGLNPSLESAPGSTSLLAAIGIDRETIEDPEGRIPRLLAFKLWGEAARQLDDPDMGLHIAEQIQPRAFNVVLYLAMSSRNLREGIERIFRYQQLFGTASRLALEERGETGFVRLDFGTDSLPQTRDQVEHLAVQLLKYCRWITEEDFDVREVHFSHARPRNTQEHERIFRCPVYFDAPECGLVIDSDDLDRPSMHADTRLARAHEEFAADSLRELGTAGFAREVEASLIPILEQGGLELKNAAASLRVSPRTLQRRLTREGTSYREVLDGLRRRVTLRHLSRSGPPIDEIVYLAGFSDPSAFYRAFKRWTAQTPAEYRARSAETEGAAP